MIEYNVNDFDNLVYEPSIGIIAANLYGNTADLVRKMGMEDNEDGVLDDEDVDLLFEAIYNVEKREFSLRPTCTIWMQDSKDLYKMYPDEKETIDVLIRINEKADMFLEAENEDGLWEAFRRYISEDLREDYEGDSFDELVNAWYKDGWEEE